MFQITEDFKTLYKGNVLVEVVTLPGIDGAHIHKSRSLMQAKGPTPAVSPLCNFRNSFYNSFFVFSDN